MILRNHFADAWTLVLAGAMLLASLTMLGVLVWGIVIKLRASRKD